MNVPGRVAGATLGYIVGNVPGAIAGYYMAKNREKTSPKTSKMVSPSKYAKLNRLGFNRRGRLMITPPRTPTRKPTLQKRVSAATKIQAAYRGYKGRKAIANMKKQRVKNAYRNVSTVTTVGKFKKPGQFKKGEGFEGKALRNGYHLTAERFGTVTDSDCVYIYHSNYDQARIARALTGALLRTLFRKAGIEIGNQEQEIPFYGTDDSDGYKIVYSSRNPVDNTQVSIEYLVAGNIAFQNIVSSWSVGGGTMGQQFIDAMLNLPNQNEPYLLSLYASDRNGLSTNWRLAATMTLQDEMIVLQSTSAIMVQNRTQGSSAQSGEFSSDRVDNQPLKGYLYQFKNGDPRLKTNQIRDIGPNDAEDVAYSTGDATGMRTFGGSAVGSSNQLMQEPPVPSIWRNVDSAAKIYLEPGTMKRSKVTTFIKNRLPELLRRLRVTHLATNYLGLQAYSGLRGMASQIIALEETLRTPTANLITCLFEGELKVGAYTYTKKIKGVFRSEMSNVTVGQFNPV